MQKFGAYTKGISFGNFSADIPPCSSLSLGVHWPLIERLPPVAVGPLIVLVARPQMVVLSVVTIIPFMIVLIFSDRGENIISVLCPTLGALVVAGRRHE